LGKPKNLGQGKPPVGNEHSFGVRNIAGSDNWNAARCIHGEPTQKELEPDRDLARSTKVGCRNVVRKPEDDNRIFGTPTIRTDIPFKEKRSIADYNVRIVCNNEYRIMVMSPKQLIFYSLAHSQKWVSLSTISNFQDLERKLKLYLKESVSVIK